jgi:hypothetical protein
MAKLNQGAKARFISFKSILTNVIQKVNLQELTGIYNVTTKGYLYKKTPLIDLLFVCNRVRIPFIVPAPVTSILLSSHPRYLHLVVWRACYFFCDVGASRYYLGNLYLRVIIL